MNWPNCVIDDVTALLGESGPLPEDLKTMLLTRRELGSGEPFLARRGACTPAFTTGIANVLTSSRKNNDVTRRHTVGVCRWNQAPVDG